MIAMLIPEQGTSALANEHVDIKNNALAQILQLVKKLYWQVRTSLFMLVLLDGLCCLVHIFYRCIEGIGKYYSKPIIIETTRFGLLSTRITSALFGMLLLAALIVFTR